MMRNFPDVSLNNGIEKISHNILIFFLALGVVHSSYAIDFPDRPLLTSSSVEPNVMLLIDSSASMSTFSRGDFVRAFDYADCPASIALPSNFSGGAADGEDQPIIQTFLNAENRVYFSYDGNEFDWGTTPGIGATGRPTRCFSDEQISNDDGGFEAIRYQVIYSTDGFDTGESGNFWNYYFSNDDNSTADIFDDGVRKFGVGRRIDLAEDAADLLIRNLTGVRLGLSNFATIPNTPGSNTGVEILEPILSLDEFVDGDSHRERILSSLSSIEVQGFTPILEAILDLGRYFIEGYEDQLITIHPNSDNEQIVPAQELFSVTPRYAEGVPIPDRDNPIIEEFCQSNFIVALTDGVPMELALLNPLIVGGDSIGENLRGYSDLTTFDNPSDVNEIVLRSTGTGILINRGVLDDVTLALQEIDLRPDLNNLAGTSVNNGVNTYYVAGFDNNLSESAELIEAANNGVGGDGQIFSAINTTELIIAFDEIFGEIVSSQGSFSTAAFSSGAVTSDTAVYQSSFRFSGTLWSGDVQAFNLDDSTDDSVVSTFEVDAIWSASDLLTQRLNTFGHEDRVLYTLSSAGDGVPFTVDSFNNSLFTENQVNDLSGGGTEDVPSVLNYLRGENNPVFRDRNSGEFGSLGDIVNSSPVVVGAPNLNFPDFNVNAEVPFGSSSLGGSYSEFAEQFSDRRSMVYVGANDGMLHGFDAESGEEIFAYLPSMVFDGDSTQEGLFYLTDTNYQHKFYVDGRQVASDVFIDPTGETDRAWRTVLVGGLRSGGRGLYALDVTDVNDLSDEDAEDVVLWEFDGSSRGDTDMGHIFGQPQIALLNNGRFAVITGNGYNSDGGRAQLFILFIEAGANGEWGINDYVEITTNNAVDNGLSTPTLVDLDGDRIVDRAYAGDLQGNMWAFDLSSDDVGDWEDGSQLLFSSSDDEGNGQPITTAPLVARNGETVMTGNEPNLLVFFGTGQILEIDDLGKEDTQSFYAVWDRGNTGLDRDDLHERRLLVDNYGVNRTQDTQSPFGDPIQWFNQGSDFDEFGWFIDLPNSGERSVTEARLLSGILFFSTSIPSTTPCSSGGSGFLNAVGTDGLATRTPIIDFNDDGLINDEDQGFLSQAIMNGVPNGSAFIGSRNSTTPCDSNGYLQAYSTSDGNVAFQAVCPENATGLGRRAWVEIFNN
jgi:type IV pilus assembly protein PilY1